MASSSHRHESCCSEDPGRAAQGTEGHGDSEQRVVQFLSGNNDSFSESSTIMEEERNKNCIFDIFGEILIVSFINFICFIWHICI